MKLFYSPAVWILWRGAVDELVAHGKHVAVVSHRSATKIVETQKHLVRALCERLGRGRIFHVPVWANLIGGMTRESTHRTRSFLFAALGAVTARLFGVNRIAFFENGIVSLNLPPLAQVVGARATRTTLLFHLAPLLCSRLCGETAQGLSDIPLALGAGERRTLGVQALDHPVVGGLDLVGRFGLLGAQRR
jgi:hypothetical protein